MWDRGTGAHRCNAPPKSVGVMQRPFEGSSFIGLTTTLTARFILESSWEY